MLKGATISLRPVMEGDLDVIHATSLDLDTRGPWYPLPSQSLAKFRAKFADSGFWTSDEGTFLIVDHDDRKLGIVSWGKLENYGSDIELAYRLFDRASMGKGIATEAVSLMADYLLDWQPVHRLVIFTHVDNVPSRRVAEKCGFTHEGTLRQAWFHRGAWHDITAYSLLRDERDVARQVERFRGARQDQELDQRDGSG